MKRPKPHTRTWPATTVGSQLRHRRAAWLQSVAVRRARWHRLPWWWWWWWPWWRGRCIPGAAAAAAAVQQQWWRWRWCGSSRPVVSAKPSDGQPATSSGDCDWTTLGRSRTDDEPDRFVWPYTLHHSRHRPTRFGQDKCTLIIPSGPWVFWRPLMSKKSTYLSAGIHYRMRFWIGLCCRGLASDPHWRNLGI